MVLVPSHSFAFLLRLVKLLLQDLAAVPTQHELSAMKLHSAANSHGIPFRQIDRPLQFVSDMVFHGIPWHSGLTCTCCESVTCKLGASKQ